MKYFFFLALITICTDIRSQSFSVKGFMAVEGGETFTYSLELKDSLGRLSGYSYTYVSEGKDVKASITGYIDRNNKTLQFKENEIIYNHGFWSQTVICLVDAQLKYAPDPSGGKTLSGAITSNTAGNALCSRGSIVFTSSDELNRLFAPVAAAPVPPPVSPKPPTTPVKPVRIVYDTARPAPNYTPAPTVEEVTQGKDKSFTWATDTVVIDLWDGNKIDGDMISVLFNNKPVLARYTLTAQKKRLALPLNGAEGIITIIAESEGNEPLTTADILLTDGTTTYPVVAYNNIGREAIIRIRPRH